MEHDIVVMHNGAAYDVPVIKKILGIDITETTVLYDTMLMSNMRYPERASHSLASWGEEFEVPKPIHEDWSKFSGDMMRRCSEDVRITYKLYNKLMADTAGEVWLPSLALEQDVARIHSRQAAHGVRFDTLKGMWVYDQIEARRSVLKEAIMKGTPWKCLIPGVALIRQAETKALKSKTYKPFRKDGSYLANTRKYFDGYAPGILTIRGPYSKVLLKPMSLGNLAEVKDYLLSLGWKPTEYNWKYKEHGGRVKSSPKLTEDSYSSIPPGLGQDIAEYNMLTHRSRFIYNPEKGKGALLAVRPNDLRIPADAMTCATPTSRYKHMGTVCNIPRPGSPWGKEIRSLFCVGEGCHMLGMDLSGIEARMLAHYIMPYPGGPELAKIITDGDFHQHNADMWGVDRNRHAKGGLYALMYGCFPAKLAETLGKPKSEGQALFDKFWEVNEPIKLLVADLEAAYDKSGGTIKGLDGRTLYVREKRTLLNTLLQHAAAMVFKKWMVLVDQWIESEGRREKLHQIIAYHDEIQVESLFSSKMTELIGDRLCLLAIQAGKSLGVKVPTPADYKVGKSWADTH